MGFQMSRSIVQRADLESRQSPALPHEFRRALCKEQIWNQGKASGTSSATVANCAKSRFGIKAKPLVISVTLATIVQRADLESRQSSARPDRSTAWIVQRADLESRQSFRSRRRMNLAIVQRADLESRQSREYRAKRRKELCKEQIWNQGKAEWVQPTGGHDCAKSRFGIKAKPLERAHVFLSDCAKSRFGIKAKPRSQST